MNESAAAANHPNRRKTVRFSLFLYLLTMQIAIGKISIMRIRSHHIISYRYSARFVSSSGALLISVSEYTFPHIEYDWISVYYNFNPNSSVFLNHYISSRMCYLQFSLVKGQGQERKQEIGGKASIRIECIMSQMTFWCYECAQCMIHCNREWKQAEKSDSTNMTNTQWNGSEKPNKKQWNDLFAFFRYKISCGCNFALRFDI